MFDVIESHADSMTEVSCISKQGRKLACDAKDPTSSGLSIDGFLPTEFFSNTQGELFCIGAGGATTAITWHLQQATRNINRPTRIIVSDRNKSRLEHIQKYHQRIEIGVPVEYALVENASVNDKILAELPSNSFVINATGMGKDSPGSPLSRKAVFPQGSVVWDLNYRGDLVFLQQAREQRSGRSLQVEDGWTYFIHGWTQAIAEVFHVSIPTCGASFDRLSEIALEVGKPAT